MAADDLLQLWAADGMKETNNFQIDVIKVLTTEK
jgi:hypothetical protein